MSENVSKMDVIEKETRSFKCPCCQTWLQFFVRVQVAGVRTLAEAEREEGRVADTPVSEEEAALSMFDRTGVMSAFIEACEWVSNWSKPSDLRSYFLTFLKNANKVSESPVRIRPFVPEECTGKLEAYTFQSMTMILEDGEYRMFLPTEIYKKQSVKRLFTEGGQVTRKELDADQWVKTKYGYVAGHVFASALALESRGSYGNATRTQRT